jgi:hypothetical protein
MMFLMGDAGRLAAFERMWGAGEPESDENLRALTRIK